MQYEICVQCGKLLVAIENDLEIWEYDPDQEMIHEARGDEMVWNCCPPCMKEVEEADDRP